MLGPNVLAARSETCSGNRKFHLASASSAAVYSTSVVTRTASGTSPGSSPGHIARGHSSFQGSAPKGTGSSRRNSSSFSGNRYPFNRNASPSTLSLGAAVWHVEQVVLYLRENAGISSAAREVRPGRDPGVA
jgi:hypothetical protein